MLAGLALGSSLATFAAYWIAQSYLRPATGTPSLPLSAKDELIGGTPTWVSKNLGESTTAVLVAVHGYGGHRGTWSELFERLPDQGVAILAPALPGHEANRKPPCTFGDQEKYLVAEVVREARRKAPHAKIVLLGLSLGGASCWLATDLVGHEVHAVISESAFTQLEPAIERWLSQGGSFGAFLLRPIIGMAQAQSGVRASKVNPIESAGRWKGPALVIHAELDRIAPRSEAERYLRATNGDLWVVPNSSHSQCLRTDPRGYVERILGVFRVRN